MHLNPVIYSDNSNHNLEKIPEIINFSETINQRNGYFASLTNNLLSLRLMISAIFIINLVTMTYL